MNTFKGDRFQRGHGLGSVFAGLLRSAIPMIHKGAEYIGKEIAHIGFQTARDVLNGEKLKPSLKKNLKTSTSRTKKKLNEKIKSYMTGRGKYVRQRKNVKNKRKTKITKRKGKNRKKKGTQKHDKRFKEVLKNKRKKKVACKRQKKVVTKTLF